MKTRDAHADTAQRSPAAASRERTPVPVSHGDGAVQLQARQASIDQSPRMLAQRSTIDAAFGGTLQRRDDALGEGAPLLAHSVAQRREISAPGDEGTHNETGMSDSLKAGIEALSGTDMSSVRVHRNSAKPAQLNAHAYAQGSEIHLGPGQERHLPHEAWHLVQQAQGRVRPTLWTGGGVAVNDNAGLEREADVMGKQAARDGPVQRARRSGQGDRKPLSSTSAGIVQRVVYPNINAMWQAVAPTFTVANIMAVVNGNAELANHYQAVIGHLNMMNFVQVANAEPAAAYTPNQGGTYNINYDIPANQLGRFSQEEFFVGAIIHEMGHVASSQLYDTQIPPGTDFHIANMHLPPLNGATFPGEQFGPNQMTDPVLGMDAQEATMAANWTVLANILAGSNDFSAAEQLLLQSRIDYGMGASPYAHYDTVLADILFYLQHRQLDATHFYAQATAMLHEANTRRGAGQGAVANVALVAAPAQDTATLHTAVGLLLNDPRWSTKGEALIGHKTPDGIRRLRVAFAGQANMREALNDVRAAAAVIVATASPRRIAVTQQAYQALTADDRAAGLAPTIAAVNGVIAQL